MSSTVFDRPAVYRNMGNDPVVGHAFDGLQKKHSQVVATGARPSTHSVPAPAVNEDALRWADLLNALKMISRWLESRQEKPRKNAQGASQTEQRAASVRPQAVTVNASKKTLAAPVAKAIEFQAAQRNFGERFDCSTHASVIKMMMLTLGQTATDLFEAVNPAGDGFDITMKDEFRVHLSRQELAQAAQASRFAGPDAGVLEQANFMFAAFVKRKQLTSDDPGVSRDFASALSKTIQGETPKKCLEGMGMVGLARYVPVREIESSGGVGVINTHDFGSAVVQGGPARGHGKNLAVSNQYSYVLSIEKKPAAPPAYKAGRKNVKPAAIWKGFYQGGAFNCVTVAAIKAAMTRFGQNPDNIFKRITATSDGYEITMRDAFTLRLTHAELRKAKAGSHLKGADAALLNDAHFLYAASAKRAQLEDNDFRAKDSFESAMNTLNDGDHPGEALKRLGLFAYIRNTTVDALAGGATGTLSDGGHSVAVIEGDLDDYGTRRKLGTLPHWMKNGQYAVRLA